MRKKKKEIGNKRRILAVLFSFFFFLFSSHSLPATHAQSFIGPCADPTSPSCSLLVSSSTRALGITTSTVYSTQSSLIFRTQGGSNQHIILMPNGKVGIATSTPTSTLTVAGDITLTGNIYGVSFVGAIFLGSVSAANVSSGVFGSLQGNGNFAFPVSLGVNTSTTAGLPQALSVYGGGYFSGNVGIGIASPSYKLDVAGTGRFTGTVSISSGATTPLYLYTANGSPWGLILKNLAAAGSGLQVYQSDAGNVHFYNNYPTGALLTLGLSGNVGIGTTDPGTYKLNVSGRGYFDDQLSARGLNLISTSSITLSGGNIGGVNKLTVTTIDPLYSIGGVKYSTYAPSVAGGVYEEYIGQAKLVRTNNRQPTTDNTGYEYVIDFTKVEEGSDLWVWRQVVEFSPKTVSALATPRDAPAQIYYVLGENSVTFRSDRAAPFSFRLVGRRFDWRNHPTRALDQSEPAGMLVP
ncbi:MAG: hypothetical protein Q7S84_04595 [bacterium]|nr:hypothetical protein [bacterium]